MESWKAWIQKHGNDFEPLAMDDIMQNDIPMLVLTAKGADPSTTAAENMYEKLSSAELPPPARATFLFTQAIKLLEDEFGRSKRYNDMSDALRVRFPCGCDYCKVDIVRRDCVRKDEESP